MPGCGATTLPWATARISAAGLGRVLGPVGAGHHDGAGAVGLEAEVEETQRRRDHARRQVVVHRQGPVVHLCRRVGVGPVAAGKRDVRQVLLTGPELEHVALGDEGEDLSGRQQSVRLEVLVVGAAAADALRRPPS